MPLETRLAFEVPPLLLPFVCIGIPVLLTFLGLLATRKLIPAHRLRGHHDVTGPLYTTLGTIYGIFLALVVATTWQFYATSASNLVQESRKLEDLYYNANAYAPGFRDHVRRIIRDYRDALVEQEWKSLAHGKASHEATRLLDELSRSFTEYKFPAGNELAFFNESVRELNALQSLRASRIDDAASGLLPFLWVILLLGGTATIVFSFFFSAENFKAQTVMTLLLTGVICLAFYAIVCLDFPYTGFVAISPEPLQKLHLE
jgi:hypothetical protein